MAVFISAMKGILAPYISSISALAAFLQLASADWQFRSRSDLAPPRLNITIPAASPDVEKGYLFIAPFSVFPDMPGEMHGPRQAGPYIFRDDGELVWSGYGYFSIWSANFQAARWKGKDVLFSFEGDHNPRYGHGHGHTTILDQHYETIRELRAGNHKLSDKHEFHIVDQETALIQVYQPVAKNLSKWDASSKQQWIVDAIFQELDIETGKLLFEWSSLEHVSPDEAVLPINPGQAGSGYNSSDAWDYFHINSVDKGSDGNYLISARDACTVYKISGVTGEIIWRLGGKNSDFEFGDNADFCFQHHARFVAGNNTDDDEEVISLYDNSAHGTEDGRGRGVQNRAFSQGKVIKVSTATRKATIVSAFLPPDGLLSKSQGSTQLLPNGNALVNWGSKGALTEFRRDGAPIFHAYMDSGFLGVGVENYRAFRYNWTGLPHETPAIVSLWNGEGTHIYVSWNGDTETDVWRFYSVSVSDEHSFQEYLGETKRKGFETLLSVKGAALKAVAADAVSADGRILASTGIAKLQDEVLPVSPSSFSIDDDLGEQPVLGTKSRWDENMVLKMSQDEGKK